MPAPLRTLLRRFRSIKASLEKRAMRLASQETRVRWLRERGLRIGDDCLVFSFAFSDDPFLIEIGNRVAISAGCEFITHDGSAWIFDDLPETDIFGTIKVGNNVYFGIDCTILPNTVIGSNCIIGSGSVVRGVIPDDSVVMGNPAKIVMKTQLAKQLLANHKNRIDIRNMPHPEKQEVIREHFAR